MKKKQSALTPRLRQNWWIDALLGLTAFLALASSLYFLAFPDGGYQGRRNPYYDLVVIFSRHTWDLLHTWSGAAVIFAALIHIVIHWSWIMGTLRRSWEVITGKRSSFGARLTYNILLDLTIAISFLLCAISGVMFIVFPAGGPEGSLWLLEKTVWDLLHTWSGVLMTIAAILHFVLHWKWVTNITRKMFPVKQKEFSKREPSLDVGKTA